MVASLVKIPTKDMVIVCVQAEPKDDTFYTVTIRVVLKDWNKFCDYTGTDGDNRHDYIRIDSPEGEYVLLNAYAHHMDRISSPTDGPDQSAELTFYCEDIHECRVQGAYMDLTVEMWP